MKIGIQIPSFSFSSGPGRLGATIAEIARSAESNGFESLWVMDHFFQIPLLGPAEQEMLEGYSTLTYCAGVTERIRLGTMVTGVTYRHPGVLAKTVTTLDVLSGGRVPGNWRGLVRSGTRGPGRCVPAHRRALRAARRDPADCQADVLGR
jgi:hypothetical protein